VLFDNLITLAQVQKVRLPALRQILVTYPNVVAGGFTVVPGDGTTHFGLVDESEPPICKVGYEDTDEREPEDLTLRTPNLLAGCAQPPEGPSAIRGARNTPIPPGQEVYEGKKDAPRQAPATDPRRRGHRELQLAGAVGRGGLPRPR
jgi:phospholipid/cholesterol/gamma-HCH transport system substrate-binding protein